MALTYSNSYSNSNFGYLYAYDSTAGTFSADLKSSSSFDYFLDSCVAGDCVYFLATDTKAFKDIVLYVGTAFAATSVEFIWEYSTGNGTWAALENVVNGDALLSTGEQIITFDIPKLWKSTGRHTSSPLVNMPRSGGYIRCRIVSVNTPTEGGAQSTQTVQTGANLLTVDSGSETFSTIRSADVSGGWGVTDVSPSGNTIEIYCNITIASGATLSQTLKSLEFINIQLTNNGTFQLGTYSSTYDYSYNGCYTYSYGFQYGGGTSHFLGLGMYKIYDSKLYCVYPGRIFNTTDNYATGSEMRDSTIEGFYQNLALNNMVVDRCRFTGQTSWAVSASKTNPTILEMWTSGNFFLGQQSSASETIENITADYISAYSVYVARDIYLINPALVNVNPLRVSFYALGGGDHDVNYHTQFRLDLKVVDNNGNAISGAGVVIIDVDGTEIFSGATDASGNIAQQVLTKQIDFFNDPNPATSITISTPTETYVKTPHTITISATGYQTKTMVLTMDRRREEIVVLEQAVKFITAGGDPLLWNLKSTDSQNKHNWAKV